MAAVSVGGNGAPGDRFGDRARPGEIVRSLVFYVVFYTGTLGYVCSGFVAPLFGAGRFGQVVSGWSRFHRGCACRLLGIRIEVQGTAPPAGALVAIKHESFYEAIDLPFLFASPAVFAKAALLRIPLWGRIARNYGVIAVERDQGAKALRAMVAAARVEMARGRLLAIFPEGTRVPRGTAPPLQAGFAGLYKLLGATVVPVAVDSGRLYHRRWKRAGVVHVRIGEPIVPGLRRADVEVQVHAAINALNAADAACSYTTPAARPPIARP